MADLREQLREAWQDSGISLPELAAAGRLGPVSIVVEDHERPDGRVFPKIVFINRLGGGSFQFKEESAIAGADMRSFAARIRSCFARDRKSVV
jgi:hypothetical protein